MEILYPSILLFLLSVIHIDGLHKVKKSAQPYRKLDFIQQAKRLGYSAQKYDVVTEDGYILSLFRIPGKRGLPVLLMHGILDSGDTWIVRGQKSLGITLAKEGYDIWVGNNRGNQYSRRHVTLNPDSDHEFWDFSFHEQGYYDLPAIIDTILHKTGASKLNAIGHSQGTAMFFVLGSTRPAYNAKVNVLMAMAPVAFLHHVGAPWGPIIKLIPELEPYLKTFGVVEFPSRESVLYKLVKVFCITPIGYDLCVQGVLFSLFGSDREEFPPSVWPLVFEHVPHSTSAKNFMHYSLLAKNKEFLMYDYGLEKNMVVYNASAPPLYDLGKVSMRVALLAGRNDQLCRLEDVEVLRRRLPNVVHYAVLNRTAYNHVNFVWGESNDKYLFPVIFEILRKYDVL